MLSYTLRERSKDRGDNDDHGRSASRDRRSEEDDGDADGDYRSPISRSPVAERPSPRILSSDGDDELVGTSFI